MSVNMKAGLLVLFSGSAFLSAQADEPIKLYTYGTANDFHYAGASSKIWTNETYTAENKTVWIEGSIGEVNHLGWNNLYNGSGTYEAYGFIFNLSSANVATYWQGALMKIGAGGLQVLSGGVFFNVGKKECVRLMANQTWSGPSAETTRKRLGVGNAADTTFMTAADGVDALTVNGWLDLWLSSPSNDLRNVTVRIEAPAVLKLPQQNDAHIRAKKLVFSGVGDFIDFGGTSTSQDWNKKTCVNLAVIDNEHLAESVELADGAGFSVTDASWELDDLTVSGTAGSTVSGSLTFPQAVNRITFATDGARLTFDTVNREGEVAAGFELVGPGTLCVTDSSALTGVQTVSEDSAFEIVCDDAMRFGGTFAGAGTVVLSGSGFVYLPEASITEFSGSILVKGGTLVLDHPLEAGRVSVSGGTVRYGDSDALLVTDVVRTEPSLSVGEGQTLTVCGNGLTAASTLALDGGTVVFMANATVSAPLTTESESFVTAANAEIRGTFTGDVNATVANLHVNGIRAVLGGSATASGRIVVGDSSPATLDAATGTTVAAEIQTSVTASGSSAFQAGGCTWSPTAESIRTVMGYVELEGALASKDVNVGSSETGYFRQNGGTIAATGSMNIPSGSVAGSHGVVYFGGGTATFAKGLVVGAISVQWGAVTVDGGDVTFADSWTVGNNKWVNTYVNLLSGGLTLPNIVSGRTQSWYGSGGEVKCYVTFDGGTLKLNGTDKAIFGKPVVTDSDRVPVRKVIIGPKGGTIDTCGKTGNTVDVPVEATPGNGILSIPLDQPITGLHGAPFITISKPNGKTGEGASAVPVYDSSTGTMTGFQVTSPGYDYTGSSVSVVDGTKTIKTITTSVLGEIASGAFTKAGEGDLTLNAACTYGGGTVVKGGMLVAGVDNAIPEGPVTIAGGTLDLNGKAATVTALFADLASLGGGLTGISAATLPDTLTVKNGQLAGADGKHSYALMNLPDGYPGGLPNLVLEGNDDPEWKLSLVNGVLKLKKDSGLLLLFR